MVLCYESFRHEISDPVFWEHFEFLLNGFATLFDLLIFYFGQTDFKFTRQSQIYERDIVKVIQLLSDLFLIRFEINLPNDSRVLIEPRQTTKIGDIVKLDVKWSGSFGFIADTLALNVSIVPKK